MILSSGDIVLLLTKLGVGAIATFLAILLWSNTRDIAWMLVVMGTIVRYAAVMYGAFESLGVAPTVPDLFGLPIVRLLLDNLPTVLIASAFGVMLLRSRIR
jgi:hypothetical protein